MTDATCRSGMQRAVLLIGTVALCVGTTYAAQGQGASAAFIGATRWQPWRAPADTSLSAAQAELTADLIRHVEMTVAIRDVRKTFPLVGDRLDGRTFWAAVVIPESDYTRYVIIYERRGGGWSEVARHELSHHIPGPVTPVDIEPTHSWIVAQGANGARGIPTWVVLRFDGESLQEEFVGSWSDIMLVDVDLDGTVEILGEEINHVNCYYCGLSSRFFSLYRWNGVEMTEVWPETLPAGSASDAAVTANNRAAELAGAERWAEALAVVNGDRALVAESAVFRRNASLIGLNAAAPDGDRLSEDTLLHYVFAGLWAEAVDIFRHKPILPDFFTTPPPYMGKYMMNYSKFGTPPLLTAVFDATTAARTVTPALPEIEFLHAWSAYHLHAWDAYVERVDRGADPSTESKFWDLSWNGLTVPGESAALEALERAAALAPNDPLFVEALRLVAGRADLLHTDAMRRTFLLFDTGAAESCAEIGCMEARRGPDVSTDGSATAWTPWRAPSDRERLLADVPGGTDLIRHFATVYHGDGEPLEQVRAFPFADGRFDGRTFWAVFDPSAPVLAVYERRDSGWRAVTQRPVQMDVVSAISAVDIEPLQAWIVVRGVDDYNIGANEPEWEILRFNGESLHVEGVGNWRDAMIADVDLDGTLEILGSETFPLCYECPVTRRVVRLYRWTGTRLSEVWLDLLPAGAASEAAVAANNRAVKLARARRWAEAVAVLNDARPLVAESAVFRRNAKLIDLNASASGGDPLSEDTLLHYVFAGSWAEAVDLFRDTPVGPDLFAERLPARGRSAGSESRYGTPPFLRAIFDATAAARAVAPARAEIEFLHAWSAFHLDPDTTVASSTHWSDPDYRIDVDESAVLEVFDRAAALAPGDRLFEEVRRVVTERRGR